MKKTAIVTYCHSPNYGAALQLFATYKAIEKNGGKAIVVDYVNEYEDSQISLPFLLKNKKLKLFLRVLISGYIFRSIPNQKRNFTDFYSSMDYTEKIRSADELKKLKDVNVFCVGSDQVWNPLITGKFDDVFFLNTPLEQKKISFSSSMGSLNFEVDEAYLKKALADFAHISVREKIAQEYLAEKTGREITEVVDPTLLFTKQEWAEMLQNNDEREIKEPYILIYAIGGEFGKLLKAARKVQKITGMKIACVTLSSRPKPVDYVLDHANPAKFVKYIAQAAFVVTNSFHGTSFSIINQVPFLSYVYEENPGRAMGLLKLCGLEQRAYHGGDEVNPQAFDPKDIIAASEILKAEAQRSMQWLKEAVDD